MIGKRFPELEQMAYQFRAIGHPMRLAILQLFANCNCEHLQVKQIYQTLNIDQPTASRHLDIMRQAGVLARQREGSNIYYRLCAEDPSIVCIRACFEKLTTV